MTIFIVIISQTHIIDFVFDSATKAQERAAKLWKEDGLFTQIVVREVK